MHFVDVKGNKMRKKILLEGVPVSKGEALGRYVVTYLYCLFGNGNTVYYESKRGNYTNKEWRYNIIRCREWKGVY